MKKIILITLLTTILPSAALADHDQKGNAVTRTATAGDDSGSGGSNANPATASTSGDVGGGGGSNANPAATSTSGDVGGGGGSNANTTAASATGDDGGSNANTATASTASDDNVGGGGAVPTTGNGDGGRGTATPPAVTASVGDDGSPIPPSSPPGTVPPGSLTRVQQLKSYLAYNLNELAEYPPGTHNYNYFRAERLAKQLAEAQAAETAGTPLPPIFDESGRVASLQPVTLY